MANKYRGEAEIKGDGTTYTVRIGSGVIAKAEKELNKPLGTIIDEIAGGSFRVSTLATLFRLGLVRKGDPLTDDQACDLIDDLGSPAVAGAVQAALAGALGIEKDKGSENPPDGGSGS